jgi:hypothetical protein
MPLVGRERGLVRRMSEIDDLPLHAKIALGSGFYYTVAVEESL